MKESTTRRKRRATPAVGDAVRVPADIRNEFARYEHSPGMEGTREPLDGLVVSIREISSGQRIKVAAGDARRYVFDLLHDQTFDPHLSAKANSQGVTAGRVHESPVYGKVQAALREQSRRGTTAAYDTLSQPPLSSILDGWRLVRVCAADVDVTEPPED